MQTNQSLPLNDDLKRSREREAQRAEFWRLPPDALVDRATIAAAYYYSVASLEAMAIRGGGPKYTRISRRALYRKRDVLDWAVSTGRTVESTAQLCGDVQ